MYPSLERKKCHCAKTLRRYLFFSEENHFVILFIVAWFWWFFHLIRRDVTWSGKEACLIKDNAFFGENSYQVVFWDKKGKLKINIILISLHYPSHSYRHGRKKNLGQNFTHYVIDCFLVARGENFRVKNNISCMKYVRKILRIESEENNQFHSQNFSFPFLHQS